MSERNTFAHFLHDAGLAAWFGGSLMGAVGINGAAADVDDPRQRARVANAGWARWTPVNAVAIGAHLTGGAILLKANSGRVKNQKGVLANTNTKLVLTAAALGVTAYSRKLGQTVMDAGDVPVAGGTASLPQTPPEVAKAQKQLKALQWAIPVLTGGIMASSALHEEQQRPSQVLKGNLAGVGDRAAGFAQDYGQKAAVLAQDYGQKAVAAAGDYAEKAKPVVSHAASVAAETAQDYADKAKPVVSSAAARAAAVAQDYADRARPALTTAASRAQDAASSAAAVAKDRASDAASSAAATAASTASAARSRAVDAAQSTRDALPV